MKKDHVAMATQQGPHSLASDTVPEENPRPSRFSRVPRMPWGGLLLLAATAFTAVTTELLPSGLLPQISRDLGVDESAVGSLTAAYAAVIVFTALPLSKFLAGRLARKALLIITILTFALSNVLLALSPTLDLAVAARLLGGVAHGILWSTMAPYVVRIVPAAAMGKAMAAVFSGTSLALAIGAPLGTMMGTILSWRTSFLVLAGVAAALGLLSVLLLPPVPRDARNSSTSLRQALKQPGVTAVATAWPLILLAHFALFTYIAPFLRAAGLPESATGISLSVVGATGLLGIWIAGLTADTYPRRALLVAVTVLTASFAALPILGSTWAGDLALMALWGTAFGAIGIYNQAAILRAGGEHRDAANGLTVVAIQIGIAIGAGYGALALTVAGGLLVPLAAAIPAAVALSIALASRHHGYPAGPRERGRRRPHQPAATGL